MNISEIKNCAARGIVIALQFNGDMTYTELVENVGTNRSEIQRGVRELEALGLIQKIDGEHRLVKVRLTPPAPPIVNSPYAMAVEADRNGSTDEKIKSVQAIWAEIFPLRKFPEMKRTRRNANRMLVLAGGSAVEVYEQLENARGMNVKSPIPYSEMILLNGYEKQSPVPEDDGMSWDSIIQGFGKTAAASIMS